MEAADPPESATGGRRRGLALVAVGGYGRRELCPGSDLDVILLHGPKVDRRELKEVAERLWYPLWDAGLKLGQAVRTVKDALALAADDLDSATALLDARPVAGDPELAEELQAKAQAQWRARSGRWLERLAQSVADRHAKAGEVAFLLEPDLKEGRGGLRDVHALRWAEAAHRILLPGDDEGLEAAYQTLLGVRVALQRRTGKATDRLLLQEQDGVARDLGDPDADALMARVAAAGRTVAWTSDEAWDRIRSSLRGPSGRVASGDRPLAAGVRLRDGLVELAPDADPSGDPALVLRAAAAAASLGTRLSRPALDRLAAEAAGPGDPWPDGARHDLVRLLGAGRAAIPVLEALDQKGLLVRVLPEWSAVRCRPQRNAYHRFTVDRHLCEAAAEAAGLADRVHRPDLLLVAAWLHDLGKGFVGDGRGGARGAGNGHHDHSTAGADLVATLAARMGFAPPDVRVLEALVRHHLLLAEVATRRDLDESATFVAVAEKVGDVETLELLHALTEADSVATGPAAWSPWKAGLVAELVARATRVLRGEEVEAPSEFPTSAQLDLVARARAEGAPAVAVDQGSLTVAATDVPGLFCRVAGTLTLNGLNVLAARAWSGEDAMAIEDFQVERVFGEPVDWGKVEADLRRAVSGRLALEARLAERARQYAEQAQPSSATPPRTSVGVHDDASETATVVEVRAPDRVGTLYRITRALADLELDIRHAKVATLGHEVVDVFYVVDASGSKLDAQQADELRRAVLYELSRA